MALAELFAWRARLPPVIIVCGVPATGKSHLARALAGSSRLPHLSSDVTRKRLVGLVATQRAPSGAYGWQFNARTYGELARRAAKAVAAHGGAIVDATFRHLADREAFRPHSRDTHHFCSSSVTRPEPFSPNAVRAASASPGGCQTPTSASCYASARRGSRLTRCRRAHTWRFGPTSCSRRSLPTCSPGSIGGYTAVTQLDRRDTELSRPRRRVPRARCARGGTPEAGRRWRGHPDPDDPLRCRSPRRSCLPGRLWDGSGSDVGVGNQLRPRIAGWALRGTTTSGASALQERAGHAIQQRLAQGTVAARSNIQQGDIVVAGCLRDYRSYVALEHCACRLELGGSCLMPTSRIPRAKPSMCPQFSHAGSLAISCIAW